MRKLTWFTILISAMLSTTGCWNRRELDRLAIVAGLGIDNDSAKKNGYIVTAQVIKASATKAPVGGGGTANDSFWEVHGHGATVFGAIRNTTLQNSRKLYFSHMQVVVVSTKVAQDGIMGALDLLYRDPEFRPLQWLVISKGPAMGVLEASGGLESIPTTALALTIESYGNSSQVVPVNLSRFGEFMVSETRAPVAPLVRVYDFMGEKRFIMDGTAIFNKDHMVGEMTPTETRGLLWVLGLVKSGILEIHPHPGPAWASIEITRAKSKMNPILNGSDVVFQIDVSFSARVGALLVDKNLSTPTGMTLLQKWSNVAVKKEIETAFVKARKSNTDIFGFGDAIERKYPVEWNDMKLEWNKHFKDIRLKISVKSDIELVGEIKSIVRPE